MAGQKTSHFLAALTTPGSLRPLDGLRAIAILLVLSMHIALRIPGIFATDWAKPFLHGWIGVDLFFVLSGYLVGGSVLRTLAEKRFSFRKFYLRRSFRILPAYFAVLIAICIIRYGFPRIGGVPSFHLKDLVPNILLLTDYWQGNIGAPSWSLSIEEHFYLLVPVLLFGVRNSQPATRRNVLVGIVVLALAGRMLTYYLYDLGGSFPSQDILPLIYYPFHSRMDSLAMGVLIALVHQESPGVMPAFVRSVAAMLGLLIIGMMYFTGALSGRWVKVTLEYTLLAAGFGTILWSVIPTDPITRLGRILSYGFWVPIARLSYSLYLTHLIVLAFMGDAKGNRILAPVIMLACCFAVALPLFFLVEEPLHRYARRRFK